MLHLLIIHMLPPVTSFSMEKVTSWLYQLKVYYNNHQGECFPWRGIHNVLNAYIWKSVVNTIRCLKSVTCKTQGHNHIFKDLNTQIIKVWFPHTHWWGVSACNAMSFPEDIIFPTPPQHLTHPFLSIQILEMLFFSFQWNRSHNYKVEIWN